MNRADFKKLSGIRLKEAKILLDNKSYQGAYYLAGYAVECALKACVAKNIKRYEFPPRNADKLYTHDLKALVALAGLKPDLDAEIAGVRDFEDNWGEVKDWSEGARYETNIDDKRAHALYTAITSEPNGVLSWLKKYW